jgi:hypothetical protein
MRSENLEGEDTVSEIMRPSLTFSKKRNIKESRTLFIPHRCDVFETEKEYMTLGRAILDQKEEFMVTERGIGSL